MLHTAAVSWTWRGGGAGPARGWVSAIGGSLRSQTLEPIDVMEASLVSDLENIARRPSNIAVGTIGGDSSSGGNLGAARRNPAGGPHSGLSTLMVRVDDHLPSMNSVDESIGSLDASMESDAASASLPASPAT